MTIVKLADVARAAGVSTAAASVALNHSSTKTIRVTAETALRIQKIAQSLGYVPNISAKRLSGKSARVIGVIMDSHAVPSAFEVLQAITQGALAVGYQVMVSEVHNSIKGVQRAYQELLRYGADGTICLAYDYPGQREDFLNEFSDLKNFVVLNPIAGARLTGPIIDVRGALEDAMNHLKARNCDRIGCIISDAQVWDIEQRMECFAAWSEANHLPFPECFKVEFSLDRNWIAEAMKRCAETFVRSGKLNAVLVFNDLYAAYFCNALQALGMSIPDDVAVIGWDNSSFCETLTPPLSSIDCNTREQGNTALRLLLQQLNPEGNFPCEGVIRARFIARESSRRNQKKQSASHESDQNSEHTPTQKEV